MSNQNLNPLGRACPQRKRPVNANNRSSQEAIEVNRQNMQNFISSLNLGRPQSERLVKEIEETKQRIPLLLGQNPNLSLLSRENENQKQNYPEPPQIIPPGEAEIPTNYPIIISFKTGHAFPLFVNATSTVAQVKEEISKIELIPAARQRLKFSGRRLLNNETMAGINAQKGALLEFVLINNRQASEIQKKSRNNQAENCLIYIKPMEGRITKLDVDVAESVKSLKLKIMDTLGIVPREQRLIFERQELVEVERSLRDYGICNESTIHLMQMLRGC